MQQLPRDFVEEVRGRASLARYAEKRLTWDRKKSQPGAGKFWACCPFHEEKTPSFSINDREGFYYCFGCQAGGDMFRFVQEIEKVSFPEALRILADQAGIPVPEASPEQRERFAQVERLRQANAVALAYYTECLADGDGRAARAYLREKRGLSDEIIERFQLGYAPNSRGELAARLRRAGVEEADAVTSGLLRKSDRNGDIYDFFRNRIMFPILDPSGRCIAFGGRAMAEDARAKYLNSPESPVFLKGDILYNYGPAREAARKSDRLLVVEGYMDVIALAAAGFAEAVAPLGTAIRENHFALGWRAAPKLVLAFDGDAAGQRAAGRAIELALASVGTGHEVSFALLPAGQDPDDLIKAEGREGIERVVDRAFSLSDMVWRHAMGAGTATGPEQRAALEQRLNELSGQIKDEKLRYHYRRHFRDRIFNLGRNGKRGAGGAGVSVEARGSALAGAVDEVAGYASRGRETVILQTLLSHPPLVEEFCEELGELEFQQEDLESLRRDIISAMAEGGLEEELRTELKTRFGPSLRRVPHVREIPFARDGSPIGEAREGLRITLDEYRCLAARREQMILADGQICEDDVGEELDEDVRAVVNAVENFGENISAGSSVRDQSDKATKELQEMLADRIWEDSRSHRAGGEFREKADG